MNACWYTKSLVCCSLFSCVIMANPGSGRIYFFDEQALCEKIDAAASAHDLVPILADQVKLHVYCAERACGRILEVKQKETVKALTDDTALEEYKKNKKGEVKKNDDEHNTEYFFQDWDKPLVIAGMKDELYIRLEEWINKLDGKSIPVSLFRGIDEAVEKKKFFEQFNQWWFHRKALLKPPLIECSDVVDVKDLTEQVEKLPQKKNQGIVDEKSFFEQVDRVRLKRNALLKHRTEEYLDKAAFDSLIKKLDDLVCDFLTKQLDDLVYEKFRNDYFRKQEIKDFLRVWLMKRGKLPKQSLTRSSLQQGELDALKKEFLESAHELRWEHERETHGMGVFLRYLTRCEESHLPTGEQLEPFCQSLACIINSHFDLYGVPSTFPEDYKLKQGLNYYKDIAKDNVRRFHALLSTSFVKVTEKDDEEKGLHMLDDGSLYPFSEKPVYTKDGLLETVDDIQPLSARLSVAPKCSYSRGSAVELKEGRGDKVLLREESDCPMPCRIFPYLVASSQKVLERRTLFAEGVQARLDEEGRSIGTPRGRGPVEAFSTSNTPATPHPLGWRPLTVAEKIWKKFQLIDSVQLGSGPEESLSLSSSQNSLAGEDSEGRSYRSSSSLVSLANSSDSENLSTSVLLAPPPSHANESIGKI